MGREKDVSFYDDIPSLSPYLLEPELTKWYPLWMKVLKMVGNNEKIIDCGCGTGQFAVLAFKLGKDYSRGIDFSPRRISFAKQRNSEQADKFVIGNLKNICTFEGLEYDTALFSEVIEHIQNDLDVIGFIKPGKRIIMTLPSYDSASHVRYFETTGEIQSRFSSTINIQSISILPLNKRNQFYIVDGVKI